MKERIPMLKKFEENDSTENLIKTMVLDPIDRNTELIYFLKFLASLTPDNRIIAVNGKWGSGKTFFLKQFQLLCNYYSGLIKDKSVIENYIKKFQSEFKEMHLSFFSVLQEECIGFVNEEYCNILYFNAWEYDNNSDPIKSLMYFLIETFKLDYQKIKVNWKELGKKAFYFLTKLEYGDDCIGGSHHFDEIISNNDIKEIWKTLLDEIINENCNKLYIILDDLDRCRPEYAIKMFERLRHFADDERVVFILAIDYEEISNMISHFYGYKDNGTKFLEKVIDQFLDLENRQFEDYERYLGDFVICQKVGEGYPAISDIVRKMTKYIFKDFNFTLRQMARYSENINSFFAFYDDYAEPLSGGLGNTILKGIVLPYVLGLSIANRNEYYKFIRGDGENRFIDFISKNNDVISCIKINTDNFEIIFREIYKFIVHIMNDDMRNIESKDILHMRLYEETVTNVFRCINHLYDIEIYNEDDE